MRVLLLGAVGTLGMLGGVSCSSKPASAPAAAAKVAAATPPRASNWELPSKTAVGMGSQVAGREEPETALLARSSGADLPAAIAREIIAASPMADPEDAKARDEAAMRLGACEQLLRAAGDKILWGGYHSEQGYDPAAYRLDETSPIDHYQLTEFSPVVWAKLYLSTFMFSGKYEVRQEGALTVLELEAKFREGLDPGDYPYPFWHNVNKWTAYCNAEKVALVFDGGGAGGRLVSSLRVAPPPLALELRKRPWDSKWTWSDAEGKEQPRVALYSYVFAKDNPHVAALDRSFRELEAEMRAQNCMLCHAPDNQGKMNELLLLNYPNQALIARHTLKEVIARNEMPPGSLLAHEPAGIRDEAGRAGLLRLADAFEQAAEAALRFEKPGSGNR